MPLALDVNPVVHLLRDYIGTLLDSTAAALQGLQKSDCRGY